MDASEDSNKNNINRGSLDDSRHPADADADATPGTSVDEMMRRVIEEACGGWGGPVVERARWGSASALTRAADYSTTSNDTAVAAAAAVADVPSLRIEKRADADRRPTPNDDDNDNDNDAHRERTESELMTQFDKRISIAEKIETELSNPLVVPAIPHSPLVAADDDDDDNSAETSSGATVIASRKALVPSHFNKSGLGPPSLTKEELENDFFEHFRREYSESSKQPLHWLNFSFTVEPSSDERRWWAVTASGCRDTVEAVFYQLSEWIQHKIASHNYTIAKEYGDRVSMELDASLPFGARLSQIKDRGGLFILKKDLFSEFACQIGDGAKHCAIVETLNGVECFSTADFKRAQSALANPHEKQLRLVVNCLPENHSHLLWSFDNGSNQRIDPAERTRRVSQEAVVVDEALADMDNNAPSVDNDEIGEFEIAQVSDSPLSDMDISEADMDSILSDHAQNTTGSESPDNQENPPATLQSPGGPFETRDIPAGQTVDQSVDSVPVAVSFAQSMSSDHQIFDPSNVSSSREEPAKANRLSPQHDGFGESHGRPRSTVASCTTYPRKDVVETAASSNFNSPTRNPGPAVAHSLGSCFPWLSPNNLQVNAYNAVVPDSSLTDPMDDVDATTCPEGLMEQVCLSLPQRLSLQYEREKNQKTTRDEAELNATIPSPEDSFKSAEEETECIDIPQEAKESTPYASSPDQAVICQESQQCYRLAKRKIDESEASFASADFIAPDNSSLELTAPACQTQLVTSPTIPNDVGKEASANGASPVDSVEQESSLEKRENRCYGYTFLRQRYSKIVDIEFKAAGIHKQFCTGRMWQQHKTRFSTICSDNCPCAYDIPFLTETVVSDKLDMFDQKWANALKLKAGGYPVGLANNFARTFIPKLKQQYSSETSKHHLDRLLHMWTIHRKAEKCGIRCREDCKCSGSWATLFRKGSMDSDESCLTALSSAPVPKKRKNIESVDFDCGGDRRPCENKRPVLVSLMSSEVDRHESTLLSAGVCTDSFPVCSSGLNMARCDASSERETYGIEFDCQRSLGFYCVSEKQTGAYCKILSICPHKISRAVSDRRLQYETKILWTKRTGGDRKFVKNHFDLIAHYKDAKLSRERLVVTFINTHVTQKSIKRSTPFFLKDWSSDGLWIGRCMTGWDGGARISHGTFSDQRSLLRSPIKLAKNIITLQKTRGVRFREEISIRIFDFNYPSESYVSDGQGPHVVHDTRLAKRRVEKGGINEKEEARCFPEAANPDWSIRDVLACLEGSTIDTGRTIRWLDETKIDHLREHVKKSIDIDSKRDIRSNRGRRSRELRLINAILKVYINAAHSNKESQSLKRWKRYEVAASSLDGLRANLPSGAQIQVGVSVSSEGKEDGVREPLPLVHFSTHISFDESSPKYFINHNAILSNDRSIKFTVNSSVHNRLTPLSVIVVPFSKLQGQGADEKQWQDLVFRTEPCSGLLGAQICLRVRRTENESYVNDKLETARQRLNTLIDWIGKFNADLQIWNKDFNDDLNLVATDVRVKENVSLLHSAINIKDLKLAKYLLEQGGGPNQKGSVTNALQLVQNMASFEPQTCSQLDEMIRMLDDWLTHFRSRSEMNSSLSIEKVPAIDERTPRSRLTASGGQSLEYPVYQGEANLACSLPGNERIGESRGHAVKEVIPRISNFPKMSAPLSASCLEGTTDQMTNHPSHRGAENLNFSGNMQNSSSERNIVVDSLPRFSPHWQQLSLPVLKDPEWLVPPTQQFKLCQSFCKSHICENAMCDCVHVHRLSSDDIESTRVLLERYDIQLEKSRLSATPRIEKRVVDSRDWFTAGYVQKDLPDSEIKYRKEKFYAVGGQGRVNKQGISWYESSSDAVAALLDAVAISRMAEQRRITPRNFVGRSYSSDLTGKNAKNWNKRNNKFDGMLL